jgi:hypothetical protein
MFCSGVVYSSVTEFYLAAVWFSVAPFYSTAASYKTTALIAKSRLHRDKQVLNSLNCKFGKRGNQMKANVDAVHE